MLGERTHLAPVFFALAIAACGGGGGAQPATPQQPTSKDPASAIDPPAPDAVCNRMVQLAQEEVKSEGGQVNTDMSAPLHDCIVRVQKLKEENPSAYSCESACVMNAKKGAEIEPCLDQCPE